MVFLDSSGLYALLDADDAHHASARVAWESLLADDVPLTTTNYVVLEMCALLQNRIGIDAVRAFYEDLLPVVSVSWVDQELHAAGMAAMMTAGQRRLSLVDCVSFEFMRRRGIEKVFCVDAHFAAQGFGCLP